MTDDPPWVDVECYNPGSGVVRLLLNCWSVSYDDPDPESDGGAYTVLDVAEVRKLIVKLQAAVDQCVAAGGDRHWTKEQTDG